MDAMLPPERTKLCPHCKGAGTVPLPPDSLGLRLRTARELFGYSYKDLSKKVGGRISASNLAQVESGRNENPDNRVMKEVAIVLGVKFGWLMGGDE